MFGFGGFIINVTVWLHLPSLSRPLPLLIFGPFFVLSIACRTSSPLSPVAARKSSTAARVLLYLRLLDHTIYPTFDPPSWGVLQLPTRQPCNPHFEPRKMHLSYLAFQLGSPCPLSHSISHEGWFYSWLISQATTAQLQTGKCTPSFLFRGPCSYHYSEVENSKVEHARA
jgi:hypothetical protein